jgi:hypothetical protein
MSLIFPWFITESVITIAADKILTPKDKDFLVVDYLPALKEATENVSISKEDKTKILQIFASMLIKFLYAATW